VPWPQDAGRCTLSRSCPWLILNLVFGGRLRSLKPHRRRRPCPGCGLLQSSATLVYTSRGPLWVAGLWGQGAVRQLFQLLVGEPGHLILCQAESATASWICQVQRWRLGGDEGPSAQYRCGRRRQFGVWGFHIECAIGCRACVLADRVFGSPAASWPTCLLSLPTG
jgi:hypothetical protein